MAPIATGNLNEQRNSFPAGYAAARKSSQPPGGYLTNFAAERKSTYRIAQIGADGIGPEVIDAGVRVVQAVAKKLGTFNVDFTELDWSSDRYKKTGSYLPDNYIEVLKEHDAIL
jgi:tartrate dehydrogenase/decarboxylase/D-malate dehydrogenase